jgi:hypothetical protein
MEKLINDALSMMARVGVAEAEARKKIEIAIFAVMLEEMQKAIQGPTTRDGYTINRSLPQIRLGEPEAVIATPVTVERPSLAGKTWKGTGRAVLNEKGDRIEIGTWINPAGDVEAMRLTRETGVPHIVDPNTGDVVRAGGGAVEIEPPKMPDPGTVVPDPYAIIQDVRPQLGAKNWKT